MQRGAEPGPLDLAAFQRRLHHKPHHVGRNCKSDAVRAAALGEDRGIDANQLPIHVDQSASRIAGIDGSVGLDEELIVRDSDLRARERRDDAAGHRLSDPERIADGQHQIADFQTVGIAERDRREFDALRVETKHRKVGLFVFEDELGRELPPVGKRHGDLGLPASLNDVIVGDHDPVGADKHARTERILNALARDAEPLAEQPTKERVVEERRDHLRDPMAHIDVDHRRRRFLRHGGKRQLERISTLRHRALRLARDAHSQKSGDGEQRRHAIFTRRFCQDSHGSRCLGGVSPRNSGPSYNV